MAEITRKRTGELLRKLFEIIIKSPEGMKASSALEALEASVQLSEYEAGIYESGRRFEKIVRFATIDCVKAGWLIKHKGTWIVTEDGIKAYKIYTDPETFYREAVKLYHQWKSSQKGIAIPNMPVKSVEEETLEESSSITFEQAGEQAWEEIERHLKGMNPYEFQDLVADLLRGMGYFVSWVSPPGKDAGVDIIAHPDPLGTQSPRIKVQVKRHSEQKVDRPGIQTFISTISDGDAGLFVCSSGFTRDAEEFVRSQERRKIMLVDLERFLSFGYNSTIN